MSARNPCTQQQQQLNTLRMEPKKQVVAHKNALTKSVELSKQQLEASRRK